MVERGASNRGAGGRSFANRMILLLLALLAVLGTLTLAGFFQGAPWNDRAETLLLKAAERRDLARQVAETAREAVRADAQALARLSAFPDREEDLLEGLEPGGPEGHGLPPLPPEAAVALNEAGSAWLAMHGGIDSILAARGAVLRVRDLADSASSQLAELSKAMSHVSNVMADKEAAAERVRIAGELRVLIERMSRALDDLLVGPPTRPPSIQRFGSDAEGFGLVLTGLIEGDAELDLEAEADSQVLQALQETSLLFATVRADADELLILDPKLQTARSALERVLPAVERVDAALGAFIRGYRQSTLGAAIGPTAVHPSAARVAGGLAVLLLVLLGVELIIDARAREAESKAQNDANQEAILRLLDEMGELADGDLTVRATVTEGITGAIADSVNYAVDALRQLVGTINAASDRVIASAQSTRSTALQLAEDGEVQTGQIGEASDIIQSMNRSHGEAARDATESAEIASRTVETAGRGVQIAGDAVQGSDAIREQINEVSKRLNRLGESSREIGEVVAQMDDLADQINILALNAAMQAATAGEAGRGFAVIAEQVQRLAERSGSATKEVGSLVLTVQADAGEAGKSIEAAVAGILKVAARAENTSDILREIEGLSSRVAELMRDILDSVRNQSREAARLDSILILMQELRARNSRDTRGTSESVERLVELAVELQQTVAGFRLPSRGAETAE